MSVTAAVIEAAGATAVAGGFDAASSRVGLPLPLLQQLLALLVLLLAAAPNARLRRQLMQLQLHAVVLQQLQSVLVASCGVAGAAGSSAGCAGCVCRQLLAHLLDAFA
jgi:hypothetical protein